MKISRKKFVLVIFSLLLFSLTIKAQERSFDPSVLSENGKKAYEYLLSENRFAIGGTGYGGETSKGEISLDELLTEKEAIGALKSLVKKATPEGGLYALLGLKILDCECFKEELKNFRNLPEPPERKRPGITIDKGNVTRVSGCIVSQQSRLDVADDIESEKDPIIKWKINSSSNKRVQN